MPFVDLVMLALFACMALAIVIDQRLVAAARATAAAEALRATEALSLSPAEATVETAATAFAEPAGDRPPLALPAGEDLSRLLPGAEGWAFVSPAGELLATNLPRRAALLAAACSALQLEAAPEGEDEARPLRAWSIARVEGPGGALLGEASGDGTLLAVLVRSGTDEAPLREGMPAALATVAEQLRPLPPP